MEDITSLSTMRTSRLSYSLSYSEQQYLDIPATDAELTRWTIARMSIHVPLHATWWREHVGTVLSDEREGR